LEKYIARMEKEGATVPAWVKEMLEAGCKSFYKTENGVDYYYSIPDKKYLPIEYDPEMIILKDLKTKNKVVKTSAAGTLYDIGDGVICLEMHTKNSVLSQELVQFMKEAQEELDKNWEGMVIAGSGANFCVGANLVELASSIEAKEWDKIEAAVKATQYTFLRNKYSLKPIVAAPFGRTLGGGCELAMQTSAIQAAGETYMGLVEFGVGLIPGGGGVKEMAMRAIARQKGTNAHIVDFMISYFQNIARAQVSTSAKEAIKYGFMKVTDGITLNNDFLIADAKKKVLELNEKGYSAPVSAPFPAPGRNELALIKMGTRTMFAAGVISEYDWYIYRKVVDVLGGGNVTRGSMITEEYLLDLEREVFLSLCGEVKTQERIKHMLAKGKPLRN